MKEHLSSQQLSDLVEGLLPPDHQRVVQAHLAACVRCQQALNERRALVERLRREVPACLARVTPPPTLRWESTRHRVPRKQRSLTMLRYTRAATANVAVLSLFVALTLGLAVLFKQAALPTRPDGYKALTGETEGVSRSESSFFFTPVTLSLQTALPPVQDKLPLYRVEPALLELSAQDVRLWAERMEMGPVRVYQDGLPGDAGQSSIYYVGLNADWDVIHLSPYGLRFTNWDTLHLSPYDIRHGSDDWFLLKGLTVSYSGGWTGEIVDETTAQATARSFLERLLPYLVTVEGAQAQVGFALTLNQDSSQPDIGRRVYDIVPQVNGIPLVRRGGENIIVVGPEGRVNLLAFTPLRLSLAGETASPRPVEAALHDVLDGKSGYLSNSDWGDWETLSKRSFFERSWSYREGDKTTAIGHAQWLYGLEGEDDLVLLRNYSSAPHTLILEGDNFKLSTQQTIQVWGTLLDYQAPSVGRLRVERVETTGVPPSGAWEGQVRWHNGALWLETESGQELLLPEPPSELPDGARAMVLGAQAYDDAQRLEWTLISAVPTEYAKSSSAQLLKYDWNVKDAPPTMLQEHPTLHLTVWWHVQDPVLASGNLFVHLLDPETGALVAQRDAIQHQGQEDNFRGGGQTLELALSDVPPGDYRLVIGCYDEFTGERLRLTGLVGDATPDGQLVLPDVVKVLPDGGVQVENVASDAPEIIVQKVELAYYVPLPPYAPELPALTEPVYLFDIYSPSGGDRLLVYVSAVD